MKRSIFPIFFCFWRNPEDVLNMISPPFPPTLKKEREINGPITIRILNDAMSYLWDWKRGEERNECSSGFWSTVETVVACEVFWWSERRFFFPVLKIYSRPVTKYVTLQKSGPCCARAVHTGSTGNAFFIRCLTDDGFDAAIRDSSVLLSAVRWEQSPELAWDHLVGVARPRTHSTWIKQVRSADY